MGNGRGLIELIWEIAYIDLAIMHVKAFISVL
jgi:hypothetical protein